MKFTTLIPTTRNDGSPVDAAELNGIYQRFYSVFGACTLEGTTQGFWMDGGTLYQDICVKLVVSCDELMLETAEALIREIGQQLGQLAMYLEVDRNADIRILRIE